MHLLGHILGTPASLLGGALVSKHTRRGATPSKVFAPVPALRGRSAVSAATL
jgi:hypothetical protein